MAIPRPLEGPGTANLADANLADSCVQVRALKQRNPEAPCALSKLCSRTFEKELALQR